MGVLADEVLVAFDGASIRRNDSFSPAVAFRVDDPFSTRSATAREVALAVVELHRELGDRVATVDCGEDLKFNTSEHGVTYYETGL